jgi:PAS domain S-box-containing protein
LAWLRPYGRDVKLRWKATSIPLLTSEMTVPTSAEKVPHASEALLKGQNQLLERIAQDAPLLETLDLLLRMIEAQCSDMFCSILLLDPDGVHLRHGAAPRLPQPFLDAIDAEPIGPHAGSCGTAAFRREQVLVEDIARDPLWDDYRELALQHGLRACWSTPVLDSQQRVLATFALYFPTPGQPNDEHRKLIAISTHIAAIAIIRHRESEAIRASEERYRQLVELSPDAIHIHQDYKLVFVNQGCLKLFGASSPDQLLGHSLLDFIHPEQREFVRERMRLQYETMRAIPGVEQKALRLDGSTVYVHVKSAPFLFDGRPAIQTVVRDITEQHRAEESQRRARTLEALGTLAGGIAHDFNNILGAILGHGELAMAEAASEGREWTRLRAIMDAGHRGAALVEQILTFARQGKRGKRALALWPLVQEVGVLVSGGMRPEISLALIEDDPGIIVWCDPVGLHQLVLNLATNAQQAMPEGGKVTVRLRTETIHAARSVDQGELRLGRYAVLSVHDTGPGIPREVRGRMFQPFYTTKEPGRGTGLGLALVQSILADHEGAIDIQTGPETGTQFDIYLPQLAEEVVETSRAGSDLPRGSGQTVLIVDDDKLVLEFAEEMLARLGYEPVGYDSAQKALEAIGDDPERFDAVLTDQWMPQLTGVQLAEQIKAKRAQLPVIVVSGYGGPELQRSAQDAGVHQLLHKPYDLSTLARALASALGYSRKP